MDPYPVRKQLRHVPPVPVPDAFYFVTICAAVRGGSELTDHAAQILEAARHRQARGTWFLALFLVMPDHLHMIVHVPPRDMAGMGPLTAVVADFKRYLSTFCGISFQTGYFDTRIRDAAHYAEKWDYIVRNPVRKGLVATPREWPHVIAFDRETGAERPHR